MYPNEIKEGTPQKNIQEDQDLQRQVAEELDQEHPQKLR